jgi:predicted nucleic acid-binding protein
MSAAVFFDTNILLYLFMEDGRRTPVAEELIVQGGVVSVQVLNELVSVARGKLKMSWEQVRIIRDKTLILLPNLLPLTEETHRLAVDLSRRHGFNIYDSLIVAAATQAGCTTLYTEDMQHGLTIGKLTIVNPFLAR